MKLTTSNRQYGVRLPSKKPLNHVSTIRYVIPIYICPVFFSAKSIHMLHTVLNCHMEWSVEAHPPNISGESETNNNKSNLYSAIRH